MFSIPKNQNIPVPGRNSLGALEIFRKLPKEALREIEGKVVERKFAKGATILLEGETADRVWFVKEGHIKAMTQGANGRTQTLCMVSQNGMFGSCCALGGGQYPCHVEAETDVTVLSLPLADFSALMGRFTQFSAVLAEQLSRKLLQAKQTQGFEQESVEKRILHALIGLVGEFGNTVPLTRREIAEIAGTTVETAIRTFSKLEADKLVSSTRGRITVKNVDLLVERLGKD
jgi:CRP-like cAMP-binding protein